MEYHGVENYYYCPASEQWTSNTSNRCASHKHSTWLAGPILFSCLGLWPRRQVSPPAKWLQVTQDDQHQLETGEGASQLAETMGNTAASTQFCQQDQRLSLQWLQQWGAGLRGGSNRWDWFWGTGKALFWEQFTAEVSVRKQTDINFKWCVLWRTDNCKSTQSRVCIPTPHQLSTQNAQKTSAVVLCNEVITATASYSCNRHKSWPIDHVTAQWHGFLGLLPPPLLSLWRVRNAVGANISSPQFWAISLSPPTPMVLVLEREK